MLMIPAGLPLSKHYVKPTFRAADVYRPVTKWSALAHNVQELPDLMRRAYQALRSGKPRAGDGRGAERDLRGRVQGRDRLHAGAGAAHRARSGRDQGSRAHAARRQEPGAVGRPGRALCGSRRSARRACRAYPRAGRHDQSRQERDPGLASARARRLDPLALEDVHRVHGQGRRRDGDRLEPDEIEFQSQHAARQDRHPLHQRSERHQQGMPRHALGGRRCRAGDRGADRRGREAEGRRPRRQCAGLAQGRNRDR